MTIGTSTSRVSFNCDGTTKVFPVPIQGYKAADFTVVLTAPLSAGGAEGTLILNSDYTLTPTGTLQPQAWTLTTLGLTAYLTGYTLQVFSDPVRDHQSQYVQGQAFPSLTVQTDFDRLTQMVQRLADLWARSIHAPDGDVNPLLTLPIASARANMAAMFDANGNFATGVPTTQNITLALLAQFLNLGQTPAELAAGVIPANLTYVSGDLGGVVSRYGAVGDGVTDDTLAIQAAIKSNTQVTLQPGLTYLVSPNAALGLAPEGGTLCLGTKSGLRMVMYGATLKQAAGTGASGAIIGNIAAVNDVRIEGGTVDCNGANTTGNQSGIVLWNDIDCDIVNVKCLTPRWIGIGHRGTLNQGNFGRNGIKNCRIEGALFISIQCARQVLGLQVHENWIENGVDNGIDVEGDVVAGDPGAGARISIQNNTINGITFDAGIFIESCPDYIIQGNTLENVAGNGIALNRIHSGAMEGKLLGNTIKGIGQAGVWINNSTGKIAIDANTFKNMVNSIQINSAGVSFLSMGKNTHEGITGNQIIKVTPVTNALVWAHIAPQDYYGARVAKLPFTISPLDNVANHGDRCLFPRGIAATYFMQSGAAAQAAGGFSDLQAEYQDGATGLLTIDGTFAGQYSLFTGGETQIHPSVVTGAWTVGNYLWLAGTVPTLYHIHSAIGGGIFTIRSAADAAGNYTGNVTGAHPCTGYLTFYQTD